MRNSEAVLIEEDGALYVDSGTRYPVDMGVLTLTSRCSLDCVMCLEPLDVSRGVDLPHAQAMRLVDIFAGKVPKIWSCAGEALLHPGFFAIAREIRRRGTMVGVGTNGLALADKEVLRRCAGSGVKWLHISCHTSSPRRFARLSGRGAAALFKTFVRGLDSVDAWNREHAPAERFEVILQLVLMKGFLPEIDAYFAFIKEHLAHSPLQLRVEPMQLQGQALKRPELMLDIDELSQAVAALIARRPPSLGLEFKSVPLCLLPGHEALSEDARRIGGGAYRVGNLSCQSEELQLVCPIGAPARSASAAVCRPCALEPLCPGTLDLPVPSGSCRPRASKTRPETVLAAAGLAPKYLRREGAPAYPADADAPRQGAAPEPLAAERLGVDVAAGRRFTAGQRRLLKELAAALGRKVAVAEAQVCDAFAAVRLGGPGEIVVFEPAAPGVPNVFTEGGVAVRYNGKMTGELTLCLDAARRRLKLLRKDQR